MPIQGISYTVFSAMTVYYVYIIRCQNDRYYTGYTTDLEKRFARHTQGRGSKFAKDFSADELVYHEKYDNKMDALTRESQLKRWSCAKKEALIKGDLNKLHELSKRKKD